MEENKQQTLHQLEEVYNAYEEREIERVFLVACGGSKALMIPSKYLIDREAKSITAEVFNSNEFIHLNPSTLNEKSLVILCSHKGKTPETTDAAQFAKDKGALTVSLMYVEDAPLKRASDYTVNYSWAPAGSKEQYSEIMNYGVLYRLTSKLLNIKEGNTTYEKMVSSLDGLSKAFDKADVQYRTKAKEYAEEVKDEKIIYTVASGANYGIAYTFSNCILMEMQWIHSHPIHAGEYFHGAFEITDKEVPFILLKGLDETRPLEERAEVFLNKYTDKLLVIDAANLDLSDIDDEIKGYLAPMVINYVLRLHAVALAEVRNHPLPTRRYMFKVAY
ncbi:MULTISPECIES: SIS domain-containing protein [Oceanobacillus]|uniref:SIS domain-containing protein n=1 Tax=Oceanobacillus TaxID=182709 RepID=UPI00211687DD|nr:SIS domain-containing protein [Oceanobacillus oncorhynchi]UUI39468.1 SIS domain-containing protein [Oceanobacillus oncorhynchi]